MQETGKTICESAAKSALEFTGAVLLRADRLVPLKDEHGFRSGIDEA
jgi:hypothetical protein